MPCMSIEGSSKEVIFDDPTTRCLILYIVNHALLRKLKIELPNFAPLRIFSRQNPSQLSPPIQKNKGIFGLAIYLQN